MSEAVLTAVYQGSFSVSNAFMSWVIPTIYRSRFVNITPEGTETLMSCQWNGHIGVFAEDSTRTSGEIPWLDF